MDVRYNPRLLNFKIVLPILFLLIVKIIAVNVSSVLSIISYLEFIVLTLLLLIKGVKLFLNLLVVISATSFEVPSFINPFISEVFSVFNLPFIGAWGFLILVLITLYKLIINSKTREKSKDKTLRLLINFSIYLIVSGLIIGAITFFINENNLPSDISIGFFRNDFSKYFTSCLLIIIFALKCIEDKNFPSALKIILFNTLVSLIIGALFSVVIGLHGFYGDEKVILMPLSFFFSTCILLFFFSSKDKRERIFIIILSAISFYLQFSFPNALGGKSWFLVVFLLFLLYFNYFTKSIKIIIAVVILLFIASLNVQGLSIGNKYNKDGLIERKITELESVLAITRPNYYQQIEESPKARIDEFLNVLIDYNQNPLYSIFGKGFGGTVKDHLRVFGNFRASFFSDDEYRFGAFSFLHETINVLLLKFGFVGLIFFVFLLFELMKNGFKSPWAVIGFLWIFFFLGYTFSLGIFGMGALVLGLFDNQIKKSRF